MTVSGSDAKERREMTMQFLEQYVDRISGNEELNLLLACHGTKETSCFSIADTNFYMPPTIEKMGISRKDPGYYGSGIYFTQFLSYADSFSAWHEAKDQAKPPIRTLLLSWLLLGRVYPVVESPLSEEKLVGASVKKDYDSHYIIIEKTNKFPCPLDKQPDFDEIVVFNPSQILPRYIVYYQVQKEALGQSNYSLNQTLIFIETEAGASSTFMKKLPLKAIKILIDKRVVKEREFLEMVQDQNRESFIRLNQNGMLRIVSDEPSSHDLLNSLEHIQDHLLRGVPILIVSDKYQRLHRPQRMFFASSERSLLLSFLLFDSLIK